MSIVCEKWNPYFKKGCDGWCGHQHLCEPVYIKYCAKINIENPPSYDAKEAFDVALDKFKQKEIATAIEIVEQLLLDYPLNQKYHQNIARFYERLNRPRANYHFRKAIAIQPHLSMVHVNYANYSYTKLNDNKTASHHFQEALAMNENCAVAHGMYGKFLRDIENDYEKSEYHFKCSIDLNSNDARSLYQYAILLHYMNNLKLSRYYFEECIRTVRKNGHKPFVWHHYQYAMVLKELKDYKHAIIELEFCLSLNHKIDCFQFQYGLLLCENNETERGIQHLYSARCSQPDNMEYQDAFDKYKAASVQKQQVKCNQYSNEYSLEYSDSSSESQFETKITKRQRASPPPPPASMNEVQSQNQLQNNVNVSAVSNVSNVSNVISEKKESESNVFNNSDLMRTPCDIEFERWLRNKISGNTCDLYYNKFKELEINDIRLVEHFEEKTLEKVINNKLHIKMFEKQIGKFKKDMNKFEEWLKCIGLYDEYCDKFTVNGILTFEAFYYHINGSNDIERIIGEKNKNDACYLWNSTPKHSRRIEDRKFEKEGKTI